MTNDQSCQFCMPFGKYRDETLEQIAMTHEDGPRYLDYVKSFKDLNPVLEEALEVFLAIPWVSELVDRAIAKHRSRPGSTEPIENSRRVKNWWER